MRRALLIGILFSAGVGMPFAINHFFLGSHSKTTVAETDKNSNFLQNTITDSAAERGHLDSGVAPENLQSAAVEQSSKSELSLAEYRAIFERAIAEGTIDSLQVLRSEYVATLPEQGVLIAEIKSLMLQNLLAKLERKDWERWSLAEHRAERSPPKAQIFVDDVRSVNPQYGKYLETSALLFNALYRTTDQGLPCSLSQALLELKANANAIFQNRKPSAVSAETLLDADILSDQTFLETFEALRAKLVGAYLHNSAIDVERALPLVLSVYPKINDKTFYVSLREFFNSLSLHATVRARGFVAGNTATVQSLEQFASRDAGVARALGDLLATYAVDALERKDTASAREAYEHAERLGVSDTTRGLFNQVLNSEMQTPEVHSVVENKPQERPKLVESIKIPAKTQNTILPVEPQKSSARPVETSSSRHELFSDEGSQVTSSNEVPSEQNSSGSSGASDVIIFLGVLFLLFGGGAYGYYRYRKQALELDWQNKHPDEFELGDAGDLEPAPGDGSISDAHFAANDFDETDIQDVDLTGN